MSNLVQIHRKLTGVIFLTLMVLFASCTGTIEDSELETTSFGADIPLTFSYQGLVEARAVAHNKFEVDMRPYQGNFDQYIYELYVNESEVPITVDPNNLIQKVGGVYTYPISNLQPNFYYSFKLKAKHISDGTISSKENVLSGIDYKTFDNQVASFSGVGDVQLIPGKTNSAVRITWTPAVMEGQFVLSPTDPAYYEVVVISESAGLDNIDNNNYAGDGRVFKRVPDSVNVEPGESSTPANPFNNPSTIDVEGLDEDTKYYVQVRAVHKLYYDAQKNGTNPIPYNKDANTVLRSFTTTGSDTPTDISRDSIVLSTGSGANTYSQINVSWLQAEGSFTGYRVYFVEYDPNLDSDTLRPEEDIFNEVGDVCELNVANDIQCMPIASDKTSELINTLAAYKTYQVKIAVCRSAACPVTPSDPLAAVFTDPKHLRTDADLSNFSGVNFINHPNDPDNTDQISLDFDAVVLGDGFADTLELKCVDPNDYSNHVGFPVDGTAIAASGIANCDGVSVQTSLGLNLQSISDANIESVNKFIVTGVKNINTDTFANATYCFSLNPAIRTKAEQVAVTNETSIVRCISPEIAVPSQADFPGLNNSCSVNIKDVIVSWDLPSKGVYNKFRVYWKEQSQNAFSFEDGINQVAGYSESALIDGNLVDYTFSGDPGKTYEIGALAIAENGGGNLYSEYNLGVVTCQIAFPIATFNEWTRIVSIGPKLDGRIPFDNNSEDFSTDKPDDAFIFEKIRLDGLILETDPTVGAEYSVPPGNYDTDPAGFSSKFDGKPNDSGHSASNTGLISFAFKSVTLSALQTEFETAQDLGSRNTRKYGYRIYRSDNNRVSWNEISDTSGLLHEGDFEYYKISSGNANRLETEKMVFFTDYSVTYSKSDDYVDRARIYWYRVVPIFNNNELKYSEEGYFPPNEIKIVLPPPNVALVNRKMANRQGCINLGKNINTSDNYSCDYNGVGSVAKTSPWSLGQTKLDLNGDLFLDRNELGCQYTRGSRSPTPSLTSSYFDDVGRVENSWDDTPSSQSIFKGMSTNGSQLVGCSSMLEVQGGGSLLFSSSNDSNFGDAANATYKNRLFGDCYGISTQVLRSKRYAAGSFSQSSLTINMPAANINIPTFTLGGAQRDVAFSDSSNAALDNAGLFDESWRQNIMIQSESFSVFYNQNATGNLLSIYGPKTTDPSDSFQVVDNIEENTSGPTTNGCFINLSSIGIDTNWKARWVPTNHLDKIRSADDVIGPNAYVDLYDKTISEVKAVPSLYNNHPTSDYKTISNSFNNDDRFETSTKLSRLFASNHSKLPPLNGLSSDQYNKVCSTFSIQVGIGNDDGSFVALTAPKKKRLPRRNEVLLASEWSENPRFYDAANSLYIGKVESDSVAGYGGCNGIANNNNLIIKNPESPILPNDLQTIYFSGSSHLDGTKHSEYCSSKYGVQDLVGNMSETESQKLYCDYSLDHLYLGKFSASIGDIDKSIEISNSHNRLYLAGLPVVDQSDNPVDAGIDWRPYEVVDEESGYCSLIDQDASLIESVDNFRDLNTFKNVYNPDGTINTDLILSESPTDQNAVNSLRNGDGSFLNFGLATMMPPFRDGNESSLTNTAVAKGKYFSPIVGLPMTCKSGANYDPCGADGADNTIASTQLMIDKYFPGQEANFIIYPLYNSAIGNGFGTAKVAGGPEAVEEINVDVNGPGDTDPATYSSEYYRVVTKVQMDIDISGDDDSDDEPIATPGEFTETTDNVSNLAPGSHTLLKVNWTTDRGEPLRTRSGGDASSGNNGRYSVDFHQDEWWGYKTGRCGVLINTDEI